MPALLFLDFMLSKAGQTAVADKGVPSIRTDVDKGLNLDSLGLDFGGQPGVDDGAPKHESGEATEVPEVDSPLDSDQ